MATGRPPTDRAETTPMYNLADRMLPRFARHFGTSPETTEALALIGTGFLAQVSSDVVPNHLTGCVDCDSVMAELSGRGLHKLAKQAERIAACIRIERRDGEYEALRGAPYAVHGLAELATLLGESAVPLPTRPGA
jgi:hypothetical protein